MYCIRQGAELNAIDSAGYTPLHWAASRGNLMSAKLLVEEGRVNSTIRDSNVCCWLLLYLTFSAPFRSAVYFGCKADAP